MSHVTPHAAPLAADAPAPAGYLVYRYDDEIRVGINHQLFNVFAILAEASVLGRTAVVSDLTLAGHHNAGRHVNAHFSRYIDLSGCAGRVAVTSAGDPALSNGLARKTVDEHTPTAQLRADSTSVLVRRFGSAMFRAPMLSDAAVSERFYELRALARPSDEIRRHTDAVAAAVGSFCIVHVRRGDMLQSDPFRFPGLDRGTRPAAIRQRLRRWVSDGETVYIMSDETEPGFFDPLKRWYRLVTYRDFPDLVRLKTEDNYLLYEVEKHLADKARIRVEMFNEYPQYGKFSYSLFDYPRTGTTSVVYRALGRLFGRGRHFRRPAQGA